MDNTIKILNKLSQSKIYKIIQKTIKIQFIGYVLMVN